MKDGIIKGTGNSRYLKSAIPAGTTWEQALAMLIGGTFPIDFNGINENGWQQLATALNKANLLSDSTKNSIGLTQTDPTVDNALSKLRTLITTAQSVADSRARIEVGSYVGTGTYGASNPNSITCSFAPKLIWIYGYGYSNGIQLQNTFNGYSSVNCRYVIDMGIISTSFSSGQGFFNPYAGNISDTGYGKKSSDGKTVYWYINKYGNFSDTLYPRGQLNEANFRYYWLALA